ncbi:MAG: threonine--tRNA ligase [Candidatus Wildermuthbacteria bacterium]|nr:threonine--tRNA ligase [Candidatus Wildermuthbacteria bacterium]
MEIEYIRHSFAHVLAAAVKKLFPKAQFGIGPVIENGFYYDFKNVKMADQDMPKIEQEMRSIASQNLAFKKELWPASKATAHFKKLKQPFKLELIKELGMKDKKSKVGMVSTGDVFLDLCRGGHVKNTKELPLDAFKLAKVAGAYWRGDEKNPMLTRIYGLAFATRKELDQHLHTLQEAEKRDHKKLGAELDLFTFSELVGPGLPLFTPKGTIVRDLLDDFVWSLRRKHGYQRVDIPHIAKKELYETSGHWDKFKNELFRITTREGHEFVVKPMNCPHHIQIFNRRKWSFRDLPQRYASTTKIYRDEQTGELSGLTRVRSITQDDAHVFCGMGQTEREIKIIWEIIDTFYSAFNLSLKLRMSLRDPKKPKQYLGDKKNWDDAETILMKIAKEKNVAYVEARGEAAFYGPKLDFMATDSLGRQWQVATIQLDLNMPKRFNLTFTNEQGGQSQIFMIHAAIMGAIERFLSILIEHYAGAFPLWLAPEQIWIVPVSDKWNGYAKSLAAKLNRFRVNIQDENETLGKKIREGEMQKIPYLLIVGEKEQQTGTVSVRKRGKGNMGQMRLEEFSRKVAEEIQKYL